MSIESEQHLIACALIDQTKVHELLSIPEDWFSNNAHKLLYRVVSDLSSKGLGVDVFSISDELERRRELQMCDGMDYLVQLQDSVPNLAFFDSYKAVLFRDYKTRLITEINNNVANQLSNNGKPEQIIEYLQSSIVEILTNHHDGGPKKISSFLDEALEEIEWKVDNDGALRGQGTGYKTLDQTIDGFESGKVYVIAGRPGMGKTQFALNVASRIAQQEGSKPWVYFSLEMTGAGLAKRLISQESKVHNNKLKSGRMTTDEMDRLAGAVTKLHTTLNLGIDEQSGLTINMIRSRLKAFQVKHGGVGGVIIDHIGLIKKDPRKDDTQGLTQVVHELQIMAKEFECPMIELCQLNRGVESRTDKRPLLSDLKQSGAIEEDARVVMMLYRDEYYNPDTQDAGITEVNIVKNSDGECRMIPFRSRLSHGEYEELINWESKEKDTNVLRAKF